MRETNLAVDPTTGNIYAAWSDFHGAGCNEILFSRSTDHGASFSRPLKISSGICSNQGPSIAIGPSGQVYVGWEAIGKGAAFVSSSDFGVTFSKARVVVTYTRFISGQFSGNGARECGDAPFNCPTGFTFPRFDLANPYLAADNVHKTVVMAFQARQSSGQGQIEFAVSVNCSCCTHTAVLSSTKYRLTSGNRGKTFHLSTLQSANRPQPRSTF